VLLLFSFPDDDDDDDDDDDGMLDDGMLDDGMLDDERQHTGRRTVVVAKMVGVDNSK
jgi:hypothetical protein